MIVRCSSCGQKNRVPAPRLHESARCGKCKTAIAPTHQPIDADATTFDEIVQGAEVPVLVDFWAAWCGPCRMAAPHVKEAAERLSGDGIVLKVDTQQHPQIAARYGVRGIPNFVVLKGGAVVNQHAGLVDAPTMERWVRGA